jgi:CDP-diacylglycerol--glycerol-3-phosphate 3-phosphatidyltransferase
LATAVSFWNVPNLLTMSRLVLGVFVFGLVAYQYYLVAAAVFGLAALTDALDGYIARALNQATPLGRQLDPLIDKVLIAGAYIFLLPVKESGLQAWMVTVIVVRELLIQGLRSHLEAQGQAFGAKAAGKLKTVFQCLSVAAILVCLGVHAASPWLFVRDVLTWTAVGLTIYSGLAYVALAMPKLTASETNP